MDPSRVYSCALHFHWLLIHCDPHQYKAVTEDGWVEELINEYMNKRIITRNLKELCSFPDPSHGVAGKQEFLNFPGDSP